MGSTSSLESLYQRNHSDQPMSKLFELKICKSTDFHLLNEYQLQVLWVCNVSFTYPVHTTIIEVVSIKNIKFKWGKVFIGHMPSLNQRIHKSRHNFLVLTVALILCVWYCSAWCFSKITFAIKIIFLNFFYFSHQNHWKELK
jgi:hypothetical protein